MSNLSSGLPGRAVVLGVSACTPLGQTASASAACAFARVSRFSLVYCPLIAGPHSFNCSPASYLSPFRPEARSDVTPRLSALVRQAVAQALGHVPLSKGVRLAVVLGVPSPRPGLSDEVPSVLAEVVGQTAAEKTSLFEAASAPSGQSPKGPVGAKVTVETLALDHAAGLAVLVRGIALLERGEVDVVLAGGVDSYMSTETLIWLHGKEQLKSELNRWGFVPGEGAGFLCLVSPSFAEARGLSGVGSLMSAAVATEEVVPTGGDPLIGKGLTTALRTVLSVLPEGERVDEVVCDLNGERWRGDDVGFSIPRVVTKLAHPGRFVLPATAFGDLGAASGPVFFAMAAHAAARGFAHGPSVLLWTSAFAGPRAAALFQLPCNGRE